MRTNNIAAVAAQYRKQKEPDIPRITAKKDRRVDRLRALGNAVYWRQFYPIFRGIMEIETQWNTY